MSEVGAGRRVPPGPQQGQPRSAASAELPCASSAHLTHRERREAIARARTDGATHSEIAERFGLSAVRIRQILRRHVAQTADRDEPAGALADESLPSRLKGVIASDVHPPATLRAVLVAARGASYPFEAAWALAAEAALSHLSDGDAHDWWSALRHTRPAWEAAYVGRPSALAGLVDPTEDP